MLCKGILVVEDDNDIRETVQQILELEGYQVFTAANGKEALDALEHIPHPCLILLDLMMPVMNGWQFLEAKQRNAVISTLPVVVVSAVAEHVKNVTTVVKKPPDIDT